MGRRRSRRLRRILPGRVPRWRVEETTAYVAAVEAAVTDAVLPVLLRAARDAMLYGYAELALEEIEQALVRPRP